jgi:hypothetical protein
MPRNARSAIGSILLLSIMGCGQSPDAGPQGGGAGAAQQHDPIAAAVADAEPNERPFLEPARPFLTALASRNYGAVYEQLSSHARAKMFPAQFTPSITEKNTLGTPIENVTPEQFAEWMAKAEAELGAPESIRHVSVFEADPEVLAGRGDQMSVAFAIGSMPPEIPANIRRASLRAQLTCQRSQAWAEAIGRDLDLTAEQVLSGKLTEEQKETVEESLPYMNVKFVLVDDGGQLKVGYFELMPPSMLD